MQVRYDNDREHLLRNHFFFFFATLVECHEGIGKMKEGGGVTKMILGHRKNILSMALTI